MYCLVAGQAGEFGLVTKREQHTNTMYLLSWNTETKTIFAGLGGVVSDAETKIFSEELKDVMNLLGSSGVHVEIDAVRVSRFSGDSLQSIESLEFVCAQRGATMTLMHEELEDAYMSENVRDILTGTSESLAFAEVRYAA